MLAILIGVFSGLARVDRSHSFLVGLTTSLRDSSRMLGIALHFFSVIAFRAPIVWALVCVFVCGWLDDWVSTIASSWQQRPNRHGRPVASPGPTTATSDAETNDASRIFHQTRRVLQVWTDWPRMITLRGGGGGKGGGRKEGRKGVKTDREFLIFISHFVVQKEKKSYFYFSPREWINRKEIISGVDGTSRRPWLSFMDSTLFSIPLFIQFFFLYLQFCFVPSHFVLLQ